MAGGLRRETPGTNKDLPHFSHIQCYNPREYRDEYNDRIVPGGDAVASERFLTNHAYSLSIQLKDTRAIVRLSSRGIGHRRG